MQCKAHSRIMIAVQLLGIPQQVCYLKLMWHYVKCWALEVGPLIFFSRTLWFVSWVFSVWRLRASFCADRAGRALLPSCPAVLCRCWPLAWGSESRHHWCWEQMIRGPGRLPHCGALCGPCPQEKPECWGPGSRSGILWRLPGPLATHRPVSALPPRPLWGPGCAVWASALMSAGMELHLCL